jgi:hypothetical protein
MQKAEAKTESFKKVVTYRKHIHYFWLSLRGEAVAISVLDNHDAGRQVRRITDHACLPVGRDTKWRRMRDENGERYFPK